MRGKNNYLNRQFKVDTLKSKNSNVLETINPMMLTFEDQAETHNCTSWVIYRYLRANPTWPMVAILKINITS